MRHTLSVRHLLVRKALKIHASILMISLGVYFTCAFFDPGLLSYDLRQKFQALADDTIVVTATVLAPPVIPVVTATADCDEVLGVLHVYLDWADDVNSYSYDIERDTVPLVSGLSSTAYDDTGVTPGTTYQYVVVAHGPMGPGLATSAPVSVGTPAECAVTAAAPAVSIVSFGGRGVDSYHGTPRTGNRRPVFTGTTSMPNATILVTIGNSFIAQVTANSNGYWEWKPPYGVSSGRHVFTVTATDPNESTRRATATLKFDILKNDESGNTGKSPVIPVVPVVSTTVVSPLQFTLSLEQDEVVQGGMLSTVIHIDTLAKRYEHLTVPIRYGVVDENGGILFSETHEGYLLPDATLRQFIAIPSYLKADRYVIQAEILLDTLSVSRQTAFTVRELPLIRLSSGDVISYADVVRNLGWIVFISMLLFFLWSYLLIREFALYLQGDGEVTEYDLERAGYIRK